MKVKLNLSEFRVGTGLHLLCGNFVTLESIGQ
jgi:hypothetical protein